MNRPPEITEKVTLQALELGYRHVRCSRESGWQGFLIDNPLQIDSAKLYANEAESANAIKQSGLDRSQIFYTTKVPKTHMGYEKAKQAIEESIAAADLGYIDLYAHLPPIVPKLN